MTKTCKVIMLPTEGFSYGYSTLKGDLVKTNGNLHIYETPSSFPQFKQVKQHVYFTCYGSIKEGDFVYDNGKRLLNYDAGIYKVDKKMENPDYKLRHINTNCTIFVRDNFHKIVATTDPSLNLPTIPVEWLKDVFIPANGSIKTVELDLFEISEELVIINNEVVIDKKEPFDSSPEAECDRFYAGRVNNTSEKERGINIIKSSPMQEKINKAADNFCDKHELYNTFSYARNPTKSAKAGTSQSILAEKAFKEGAEFIQNEAKREAILFGDWIKDNYDLYYNGGNYKWGLSTGEMYTTKQLYALWKQNS